ncbi:uncharacterized protein H6S33_010024 [Morchella sextelata]|jgi:cytochrome c oxidase assembly factor 2|uniref:uncharacterized protein n=1 Tax=Morchella sextelata TaxID=1174677 RepID=UPI001D03EE57|nr:uncharacterized protein H6S33_010024 [Morchella sextelata]KAH0611972.1 hypothetical protein H6S33_010024 [Morchella sextelata]
MPPAMHPKSFSTASLFTSTAVLAFLVVAAPHILPCPATGPERAESASTPATLLQDKQRKKRRKCPLPRPTPGGLIGEVLGKKEVGTVAKEIEAFKGKKVVFEKRTGEGR